MELSNAYNLIAGKLEEWLTTTIAMLPNLAIALLVLVAFYVLGKLVRKFVNSGLSRVTQNKTIINLLETVAP